MNHYQPPQLIASEITITLDLGDLFHLPEQQDRDHSWYNWSRKIDMYDSTTHHQEEEHAITNRRYRKYKSKPRISVSVLNISSLLSPCHQMRSAKGKVTHELCMTTTPTQYMQGLWNEMRRHGCGTISGWGLRWSGTRLPSQFGVEMDRHSPKNQQARVVTQMGTFFSAPPLQKQTNKQKTTKHRGSFLWKRLGKMP